MPWFEANNMNYSNCTCNQGLREATKVNYKKCLGLGRGHTSTRSVILCLIIHFLFITQYCQAYPARNGELFFVINFI